MKTTSYCYLLLIGLMCLLTAGAQTNSDMPAQPAETNSMAATAPPDTNTAAPPPVTETTPTGDSAAQATARTTLQQKMQELGSQPTNAPDASAATAAPAMAVSDTNAPTANMTDTNVPVASTADTNAAAMAEAADEAVATNPAPEVAIPVIKFTDVNLTAAIEALARQANINYMLDPKIGYGQPDANGVVKVEPVLSIRWENITAESALLALLDNYGLQLIQDKRTGIDRITMKEPNAPPPLFTKVIQLKYASVANMMAAAQSVLTDKRSKVLPDSRTSQLVVVATDPEQQAVETLVEQLDKPTRQVLIETRLVDISSNPDTKKGVDWTGTLQANTITFGQPTADGLAGGGVNWTTGAGFTPGGGILTAQGLSVVLSYLNSSADAQVMSVPRVVTLDNEEAQISFTRGYPIFSFTASSANNTAGSSVTYSNIGTTLEVTPRISANDYIWLKVVPIVSSFFENASQSIPNGGTQTAPVFDTRTLTTQVQIPNANTLVLGGLVQDNPHAGYTKVPLLGDIPGLGWFFSSSDKQLSKDNLIIFITPTIVKDSDYQPSQSGDFLKTKSVSMKDPMNPNSEWDGPEPGGKWANPITDTTK